AFLTPGLYLAKRIKPSTDGITAARVHQRRLQTPVAIECLARTPQVHRQIGSPSASPENYLRAKSAQLLAPACRQIRSRWYRLHSDWSNGAQGPLNSPAPKPQGLRPEMGKNQKVPRRQCLEPRRVQRRHQKSSYPAELARRQQNST